MSGYAERGLLSFSQVEAFATWAEANGFARERTKGVYEILRLRYPGEPPVIIFRTDRAKEHATVQGTAYRLVRRWLNAKRDAERAP